VASSSANLTGNVSARRAPGDSTLRLGMLFCMDSKSSEVFDDTDTELYARILFDGVIFTLRWESRSYEYLMLG